MSAPLRAAVVAVGDELLLGRTVDTNAAWLGRSLAGAGVPVVRRHTVGDVASDIGDALTAALASAEVVLVSGGLGPTPDDLTREAVAERLGRALRLDEELLRALRDRFERRGLRFPETNRAQALVPEGAELLPNPHGTAPGLVMLHEGRLVVLLPGVPMELRGIFDGSVLELLGRHFGDRLRPVHVRTVHTTGIPESRLAELVAELMPDDPGPVRIASLPDLRGVDLRLTAMDVPRAEAERHFDRVIAALDSALAPGRFEAPSGDLSEAVLLALRARGLSLAVAESCTGGLLAKRLTDWPGASDVFVGGVIAYDNRVKVEHLGVEPADLDRDGAVSESVVQGMARGAAARLGTDAAIAVTGVAGPGGGTPEKPVGTVWIAGLAGERHAARRLSLPGDREAVRERAAQAALALLLRLLNDEPGG